MESTTNTGNSVKYSLAWYYTLLSDLITRTRLGVMNFLRRCKAWYFSSVPARHEHRYVDPIIDDTAPPSTEMVVNALQTQHDPLSAMPVEIILLITQYLDEEHVALLSLTCKRLHHVLRLHYDLSLQDSKSRLNFFTLIESDLPEFYACRGCLRMYKWGDIVKKDGWCSQRLTHPRNYVSISYAWYMYTPQGGTFVSPIIIDLILRGQLMGSQYGIPPSFLTHGSTVVLGVSYSHEARMVDGDFMLASYRRKEVNSHTELMQGIRHMGLALCEHCYSYRHPSGIAVDPALLTTPEPWSFPVGKCEYCETDYKYSIRSRPTGGYTVRLVVWRNYGRYRQQSRGQRQIFHTRPKRKIDGESFTQRDLRSKFRCGIGNEKNVVGWSED